MGTSGSRDGDKTVARIDSFLSIVSVDLPKPDQRGQAIEGIVKGESPCESVPDFQPFHGFGPNHGANLI
jgi:hypothetical protein